MKSICKGIIKFILAGVIAVAILSLLVCPYLILPVHIDNPNNNTDYIWPANSVYVNQSEGMGWGRHDEWGYNNLNVVKNPDVIVLGSSHMEGHNVRQNENTAYFLSEKLGDKYSVYNLAISGNDFYKTCQYIPSSLELFDKVPSVVIVETSVVDLDSNKVEAAIEGTLPKTASTHNKLIIALQSIPFFRLAYHQLEGGLLDIFLGKTENDDFASKQDVTINEHAYKNLFEYLAEVEETYNTNILIFYHPTGEISEEGSLSFDNSQGKEFFSKYADNNEIDFVDMTEDFANMYDENHIVAHGFSNGRLEKGHLNRYGHKAIATRVYNEILNSDGGLMSR